MEIANRLDGRQVGGVGRQAKLGLHQRKAERRLPVHGIDGGEIHLLVVDHVEFYVDAALLVDLVDAGEVRREKGAHLGFSPISLPLDDAYHLLLGGERVHHHHVDGVRGSVRGAGQREREQSD